MIYMQVWLDEIGSIYISSQCHRVLISNFPQDCKRLCRNILQSTCSFPQLFESFPILKPIEPLGEELGAADGDGPLNQTFVLATPASFTTLQQRRRQKEGTRGHSGWLQCPWEEVEDNRKAEVFQEAQFWRREVESCFGHPDPRAGGGGEYPGCP